MKDSRLPVRKNFLSTSSILQRWNEWNACYSWAERERSWRL